MAEADLLVKVATQPKDPFAGINNQLDETDDKLAGLSGGFAKVAGAIGGLALAGKAFDFVIDATREMEDLTTQFITFTGSAKGAENQLQALSEFAASSPFQLKELAEANRTLLAFGSGTKQSINQLAQLSEVAAATGSSIKDLSTIFGQIQAQGKLTGERFNQLIERGVNIGPELAKSLGVAESSLQKLREEGKISADEVAKAFERMTGAGGQFFGATERQSQTLSGSLSTLSDSFSILASTIGSKATPALTDFAQYASYAVNSITDFVKERQKIAEETGDAKRLRELNTELADLSEKFNNLKDPSALTKVFEAIGAINVEGLTRDFGQKIIEVNAERNKILEAMEKEAAKKRTDEANDEEKKKRDKANSDRIAEEQEKQKKLDEIQDKASQDRTNKLVELESQLTVLELQADAARTVLKQEQQAAANPLFIEAAIAREAEITSQIAQANATRAELLLQYDQAEFIRAQDQQKKLTDTKKKGEAERLAVIRKAQKDEIDIELQTSQAKKQFDEQTYAQRIYTANAGLNALASLMKTKNREAFEIGKAAAIAQALVAIPITAIEAYKSLAGIPFVGPALGATAAAAAVIAGTQNLNEIYNARLGFAEGGVVPGVGNQDTVPILATPGEVIVPEKNFADISADLARGAVNDDQVRLLEAGNAISAKILEQITFGAIIEKMTIMISLLDKISNKEFGGGGFSDFDGLINDRINERERNQPEPAARKPRPLPTAPGTRSRPGGDHVF